MLERPDYRNATPGDRSAPAGIRVWIAAVWTKKQGL